jgi:RHS repeat-associated protein
MFGARYYGSSLGRFMTPDWSSMPTAVPYADLSNPQSLNLYSYTKNNPTTLRDPNGHCDIDGEHHNWVWCAAHAVGLTYTRHETAENIRFGFNTPGLGYPTLYKNGRAVDWNKLSDEEVIQTATEYNDALREGRVVTMTPAAAAALTQWGWPGQQSYNEAKNLLNEPNTSQGTVDRRDLLGKVPTEDEAVKMIEDAGGKVERIEGGHAPGGVSPHENPHINYTTASGAKGTIDIQQ